MIKQALITLQFTPIQGAIAGLMADINKLLPLQLPQPRRRPTAGVTGKLIEEAVVFAHNQRHRSAVGRAGRGRTSVKGTQIHRAPELLPRWTGEHLHLIAAVGAAGERRQQHFRIHVGGIQVHDLNHRRPIHPDR